MLRPSLLAVLVASATLAGCFGGSGGGGEDGTEDVLPMLPAGLTMEGAEVIDRDDTSVLFAWNGSIPATDEERSAVKARFDVPAGLQLDIGAWVDVPEDADVRLYLFDETWDGTWTERPYPGLIGGGTVYEADACPWGLEYRVGHVACFYDLLEPLADEATWTMVLEGRGPDAAIHFEATLRLATVAPVTVHRLDRIESFETTTPDGTVLRGHVYLPEGDGPFGTVLEYSAYWSEVSHGSTDVHAFTDRGRPTITYWAKPYLDAGFAVALVSERGSGRSDGCFELLGPNVGADGALVVETLAARPWSNGRVAMTGFSLPAGNAFLTIANQPPSLAAAVLASGHVDFWYHNMVNHGARVGGYEGPLWGKALFDALVVTMDPDDSSLQRELHRRACTDAATAMPEYGPHWNGDKIPALERLDLLEELASADVPMLATAGLREDMLRRKADLLGPLLGDENVFVWGYWDHIYPTRFFANDYEDLAVRFLQHHLHGARQAYRAGVAHVQDDRGQVHTFGTWPPEQSREALLLSGDLLVPAGASVATSEQAFQSADRTPSLVTCGPDQVLFRSPPLSEELLLIGNADLNLTLTSTLPNGNLVAHLYHGPGRGDCGDDGATLVARFATDLYHRGHLEIGREFPVGVPERVDVLSDPLARVVPAGDRLVLVIAGGDNACPGTCRIEADPGCSWVCSDPKPWKPVITVATGPGIVAELILPVLRGEVGFQGWNASAVLDVAVASGPLPHQGS